MAVVLIGAPLAGVRGTVGGITFSANKAGPYMKAWAKPSNARTSRQTVERGFLGQMPELWRALTGVQQAAWDTFAALGAQALTNSLGVTYYLSGFGWFCKCNIRLLRVGRATITAVPTQARPAAPTIDDFRVCVAGTESDLCVGGTASASTEHLSHLAADGFDDDGDTFWSTLSGSVTGWLRYDLLAAKNVKRYRILCRTVTIDSAPRDWTFEVYTGGAWEVLQTVTGVTMAAGTWYDFYCANPYTETDYRLNVSANNGSATYVQVAELELYAGDEGSSVVVYPEDEFDDSPDWDLVLHVAMGNTVGMQVEYPGFHEMLAKQAPGRWYELFQTEVEAVFGTILENRSWFARLGRQTAEGLRSSWATQRGVTLS